LPMRKVKSGRILAVDYGRKRVGLAWSDEMRVVVSPLKAYNNDENLLNKLVSLITENNVTEVVFGIPLRMSGEEGELAEEIKNFAEELSNKLPKIAICFFDESLTSKDAEALFKSKHGRYPVEKRDKYIIDSYSAAILLEEYLRKDENF